MSIDEPLTERSEHLHGADQPAQAEQYVEDAALDDEDEDDDEIGASFWVTAGMFALFVIATGSCLILF